MDIQEKLDTIEQRRQDFLNQTNSDKNTQLIKASYDEYVSAKEINNFAPSQLEQAETNYYKAKYGIDYIDKQKEKYKTETIQMTDDKLKAHQEQLAKVNETLDNYKNSEKYSKGINEVKAMHLAKIKSLIQKIRLSDANTNQQKTFYTEQEEDTINSYIVTLNWFITIFTMAVILDNRSNIRRVILPIIFLLSIVLLLKPLLRLGEGIFKTQFNIGYDPMKSKIAWILYGVLILIAIWIWVYLDMLTMMLTSTFMPPPTAPGAATGATGAPATPPILAAIRTALHTAVNNIIAFFIRVYTNMTGLFAAATTAVASSGVTPSSIFNSISSFFRIIYLNIVAMFTTASSFVTSRRDASRATRPPAIDPSTDGIELR